MTVYHCEVYEIIAIIPRHSLDFFSRLQWEHYIVRLPWADGDCITVNVLPFNADRPVSILAQIAAATEKIYPDWED